MAVTILQQPDMPNFTGTKLVYTVSSTNTSEPQFQYVCDIKQGTTLLARIKQYANPAGKAVFELADVFSSFMTDYISVTYTSEVVTSLDLGKFQVYFGEEYGTSLTSAVTLYNGLGSVGDPAVAANETNLYPGVKDPNDPTNGWDWDSTLFVPESGSGDYSLTNDPYKLTSTRAAFDWVAQVSSAGKDKPFKLIGDVEYDTQTFVTNTSGSYPSSISVRIHGRDGTLINSFSQGLLPYSGSGNTLVLGTGTHNLLKWDPAFYADLIDIISNQDWAWYQIGYISENGVETPDDGTWYVRESIVLEEGPYDINVGATPAPMKRRQYDQEQEQRYCTYEKTRFLFTNNYGATDSYSVWGPVKRNSQVKRDTTQRTFVDYSGDGAYEVYRRGEEIYNVEVNDSFSVTTPYLEEEVSNWLTELLDSTNVYLDRSTLTEDIFVPIVITNVSYEWKKDPRSQKLFQYTITWKYANQRYSK